MASIDPLLQSLRFQSFLELYLPYLLIFAVVGTGVYYLLGRLDYFENLEGNRSVALKLVITLFLAGILSQILRVLLLSITGV